MTDSQAKHDPISAGSSEAESSLQSGVLEQSAELFEPEWPAETPGERDAGTLLGCTVACPDQLPAARVLRDTFRRHHPDARFALLLVDQQGHGEADALSVSDIGLDPQEFAQLAVGCTAEQLRTVLRPRFLQHLLKTGHTTLYFEPSVQVFGRFDDLLTGLTPERPVALVPRVLRPLAVDGLRPSPADLAESGTFDPSVFAVRPGAEQLLKTWVEQLRSDPAMATPVLDDAPALVDHKVIRDPGVGLSVWNAGQRALAVNSDGKHTVDGAVLRSVHFDGFQPQRPWLLSTAYADRPRILLSEHQTLAGLCAGYRNALVEAGYTREQPHPFDALPDGVVLPTTLRGEYLAAWLDGEAPPSPFEPDALPEFQEWACAPADDQQRAAGASRWTAAVWADDPILRRDYPDPFGADAESFHEWCVGVGVASGRVPAEAVHRRIDNRAALVDQLGVAVLGEGPLAELVRDAVRASGLPSADTAYYPVVLRCTPDLPVPAGRYVIDVHTGTVGSDDVAETWVLSESSRAVARRSGAKTRVLTLPAPERELVDLPMRKGARARLGLSDEFVITTCADHAAERADNVLGVVSAFLSAFPERSDVRLLIGVVGAGDFPEAAERLRLATAADPRIQLVEDAPDLRGLLSAADCFTSLHRGGATDDHVLRLLEVAAHGVPVIAGDHGAVSEVFGAEAARLVPCQGPGEPDIDAAAELLRAAADDADATAAFGAAARESLLATHTVARAGARLRERVEHAYRNWRTKWSTDRHGQFDDPLRPLLVARHALHRAPDAGVSSRNSMAPALRKAVLKALSHYDEHIRDVMRSLVDGVEQTASELLRRQYEADGDGDVEAMRAELAQFAQRQDQLGAQLMGTEDGVVRARADLAEQHRRLRELESGPAVDDRRVDALAERLDSLTGAVERILDRMDALEKRKSPDQNVETSVRAASADAANALQRTDVLQRILLREHERNTGAGDGTTTPVLCDAGLLRLPADDSFMLPWLSSHPTWDTDASTLIDSLLEPDGIFLDIGAYVGYQTVRVLSRLGNSGAVVAVEPCPRSANLLKHNVQVNVPAAWGHRMVLLEGAAWDAPCDMTSEASLAGGLSVRPAENGEEASVRGIRLDRELEGHAGLKDLKLSVVHVDVGARVHRVLGGLVRLLRRDRPSIVCSFTPAAISQLGDDPAAALREFGTWGYDLVPVGRTRPVEASDLLEAINAAGSANTVKLWLRPKQK
ncbi:FkbM family methyltransferase [Saccharopolyspora indica]|uniref:FkbM family methyltransferase n=1 Tax=Saccharopolyspora indica TaxID=1229659 RepID=UPI0022EB89EE|nr:FkbM family methyltransferase [Saccharopolyspora indica]MDA3649052.1 FkbM family methyltransferase [Saccharopolyspora indica]